MLVLNFLITTKWALQECSLATNESEVKVCIKGSVGLYSKYVPAVLDTWLYLLEIINVNENENSIHIFIELLTYWNDTNLALSDGTEYDNFQVLYENTVKFKYLFSSGMKLI